MNQKEARRRNRKLRRQRARDENVPMSDEEQSRRSVLTVGKYAGRTLAEVAACDRGYLVWIAYKSNMREWTRRMARLVLGASSPRRNMPAPWE